MPASVPLPLLAPLEVSELTAEPPVELPPLVAPELALDPPPEGLPEPPLEPPPLVPLADEPPSVADSATGWSQQAARASIEIVSKRLGIPPTFARNP